MASQWYCSSQGEQKGPVDSTTLEDLIAAGIVTPSSLVWHKGMAKWTPASRVPELKVSNFKPTKAKFVPRKQTEGSFS